MDYEQENESQARRPLMMLMARAVYSLGGMAYVDLFIPLIFCRRRHLLLMPASNR